MRIALPAAIVSAWAALATPAQATLITFDELPWRPIESFSDYPVDTQYASLGVTFDLGYLMQIDNLYFGQVAAVPEPASMLLGAAGLGVLAWAGRRRKR